MTFVISDVTKPSFASKHASSMKNRFKSLLQEFKKKMVYSEISERVWMFPILVK